jgi:hypothetical protein
VRESAKTFFAAELMRSPKEAELADALTKKENQFAAEFMRHALKKGGSEISAVDP